jgi:hypothetical protein
LNSKHIGVGENHLLNTAADHHSPRLPQFLPWLVPDVEKVVRVYQKFVCSGIGIFDLLGVF